MGILNFSVSQFKNLTTSGLFIALLSPYIICQQEQPSQPINVEPVSKESTADAGSASLLSAPFINVEPVSKESTALVVKPSTIIVSSDEDYLVGHNAEN